MLRILTATMLLAATLAAPAVKAAEPPADSVRLADLTWPELRAALADGTDTVLVPIGGTEQGGLHLVLGKHNFVVAAAAEQAARRLGGVLVAPVLPFAPEGDHGTREGNLAFPGTIGLRPESFANIAVDIALSLKLAGVPVIAFVAEHGQGQEVLAEVARGLDAAWRAQGTRVLHVAAYYDPEGQRNLLLRQGESAAAIGRHAGIADTSELLAVHPQGVRPPDRLVPLAGPGGGDGDPSRASAERGLELLGLKINTIVAAIEAARAGRR